MQQTFIIFVLFLFLKLSQFTNLYFGISF